MLPTAPAAADTQTSSPSRSPATRRRPGVGGEAVAAEHAEIRLRRHVRHVEAPERADAAKHLLAGGDDGVVAPPRRMPDDVAGGEPVGVRLDHLADRHDPVHRRPRAGRRRSSPPGHARAGAAEAPGRPTSTCCGRAPGPARAAEPASRRPRSRTPCTSPRGYATSWTSRPVTARHPRAARAPRARSAPRSARRGRRRRRACRCRSARSRARRSPGSRSAQ